MILESTWQKNKLHFKLLKWFLVTLNRYPLAMKLKPPKQSHPAPEVLMRRRLQLAFNTITFPYPIHARCLYRIHPHQGDLNWHTRSTNAKSIQGASVCLQTSTSVWSTGYRIKLIDLCLVGAMLFCMQALTGPHFPSAHQEKGQNKKNNLLALERSQGWFPGLSPTAVPKKLS